MSKVHQKLHEAILKRQPEDEIGFSAKRKKLNETVEKSEACLSNPFKSAIHGNVYQIKLLLSLLIRASDETKEFQFRTEMQEAEKFENEKGVDIVFFEKHENEKVVCKLISVKHTTDKNKKLTLDDFKRNNTYDIQQYFQSYQAIKKNPLFKNYIIDELELTTNFDIDENLKDEYFQQLTTDEKDFVSCKYRLKSNTELGREMYKKVEEASSDLVFLAQTLAQHVIKNEELQLNTKIFRDYHVALINDLIIDKEKSKFHEFFIKKEHYGGKADEFRRTLIKEFMKVNYFSEKQAEKEIESVRLKLSPDFGNSKSNKATLMKSSLWDEEFGVNYEEINEFFEKLVFVVNKESDIDMFIKRNLKDYVDTADTEISSSKMLFEILDRTRGKLLEKMAAERIIKEITQKMSEMSEMSVFSHSHIYKEKLKQHEIHFEKNMFNKNWLESLKKINIVKADGSTFLTAIKIHKCITFLLKEKFLFISQDLTNEILDEAFESSDLDLIIIVCKNTSKLENYLDVLRERVNKSNKRIAIIVPKESNIDVLLKNKYIDIYERYEDKITFDQLTNESQTRIKEKRIHFLNTYIPLKNLLSSKKHSKFIDAKTLSILIEDKVEEEIDVPKKNSYYIMRHCSRNIEISDEIFSNLSNDVLLIEVTDSNSFKKEGVKSNHICDNTTKIHFETNVITISQGYVKKYFDTFKKHNRTVHWLKYCSSKLLWLNSHGSISCLLNHKQHLQEGNFSYSEDELIKRSANEKIIIIASRPGDGKSALLSNIMQNLRITNSTKWAIKIQLCKYMQLLLEINEKIMNDSDVQISFGERKEIDYGEALLRAIAFPPLKKEMSFEEYLLSYYFKNGRLIIMFDGFDEVAEPVQKVVIKMLQKLKKYKNKILVTTRNHMLETLEKALNTFAYTIEPLNEAERITYLCEYWNTEYLNHWETQYDINLVDSYIHPIRIKTYARMALKTWYSNQNGKSYDFNPSILHLKILAEQLKANSQSDKKEWQGCFDYLSIQTFEEPIMPEKLDKMLSYYEKVTNNLLFKTPQLPSEDGNKIYNEAVDPEALEICEIMAVQSLLKKQDSRYITADERKKIEISDINARTGDMFSLCSHPIHFTHEEYLASKYLFKKNFHVEYFWEMVEEILAKSSPVFSMCFMKMLQDDKEKQKTIPSKTSLLNIAARKNLPNLTIMLFGKFYEFPATDASKKTPLHYAVKTGNFNLVIDILTSMNDVISENNSKQFFSEYEENPADIAKKNFKMLSAFVAFTDKDGKSARECCNDILKVIKEFGNIETRSPEKIKNQRPKIEQMILERKFDGTHTLATASYVNFLALLYFNKHNNVADFILDKIAAEKIIDGFFKFINDDLGEATRKDLCTENDKLKFIKTFFKKYELN